MKKRKIARYEQHMIETLKTFTDAIMSIIATLMVLEIPVPHLLNGQHYALQETFNALVIFFVSFLVVLSYYFDMTKFFHRIHKISGLHVFLYVIFLMLLSLFPFMTQVNIGTHPTLFTIVYVIYIVVVSRFISMLCQKVYQFNGITLKRNRHSAWDLLLMATLAIVLSFFVGSNGSSFVLLYLPIRSLISSVVFDDENE